MKIALIGLALSALLQPVETHEVTFRTSDGHTLGARIFEPSNASGRLPALLLVPGSRAEASALARQGIAVMAPESRVAGDAQLADDALRAFSVLRAQPGVDAGKAGIWGVGEGARIAPLATARSLDVKFMITDFGLLGTRGVLDRTGVRGSVRGALDRVAADPLQQIKQPVLDAQGMFRSSLPGELFPVGQFPPGYAEAVGAWIHTTTSSAPPPTRSPWWESWQSQLGLAVLMVGAFAAYLLSALRTPHTRHALPSPRRTAPHIWPACILAISGLLTVPGFVMSMLRMTSAVDGGAIDLGPLLAGRPLDWIVLQVLSFTALISALLLATRWRTTPLGGRILLCTTAITFIPWAFFWGLLIP